MKKEIRDQSAHFAGGFLVVLIAQLLGAEIGVLSGLVIGLAPGLSREITEEGEVSLAALRRALRSCLDLSCWALGGAVGGLA